MKARVQLLIAFLCLWLMNGCGPKPGSRPTKPLETSDLRLVSLAPSVTEMLFALGLGDCLVADTEYCMTPEAAIRLPKVGAWTDANLEQILSFSPTHVCLPATHPKRHEFEALGVDIVPIKGQTLEDVLNSIGDLGKVFHCEKQASGLLADIRRRMKALKAHQKGRSRFRALVMISRRRGEGVLRNMIVAGDDGYFSALLDLVGCDQVPRGVGVSYPTISVEGILALNPDLVLEIAPEAHGKGEAKLEAIRQDWTKNLPNIKAVKYGRILVFTESWATVPGVRSVLFAERLAELLDKIRESKS